MFSRWRRGASGKTDLGFGPEAFLGLAEGSPDLLAIASDDEIVFANAAARAFLTGSRDANVLGRSLLSVLHPEDRDEGRARLAAVLAGGKALDWTAVRLVSDSGAALELWVRIAAIEFRGRPSLIVIGRDESTARRAQREREDSERAYQTLANTVAVLIVRLDAEDRCVYINEGWRSLAVLPPEDALGRKWTDLVQEPYRSRVERAWRRIRSEGRARRGEFSFARRDGQEVTVIAHVVPEHDASGAISGWVATLTDVTDRKRTERALAESEERLRISLDAAGVASWETDNAQSDLVRWSPNAASVLGVSDDEVPRTRSAFWALVPDESVSDLRAKARATIEAGEVLDLEIRVPTPGGRERWLAVRGRAYSSGGQTATRMAGIVTDVTARRRLDEEREALVAKLREAQRLESLGLLAGGVAHDFNNLLVGILGNAELALAVAPADAALRVRLEELRAASLRAAELAQQILAYSGRGPLLSAPVEVGALARETLALLQPSLPPHARVRIEAQPDAVVEGDATQLRQVLMNLVRNAAESLDASGGDVTVGVTREPGGEHVHVSVLDTGCGMDAATRARIFDPFFTTRATGRGLGLAVVHGIVRAHGGEIAVESEPGRGTRVDLRLPASRVPCLKLETPHADAPDAERGRGLVLVIDDERAVRNVAQLALEAAGYSVMCAADGAEASARAREAAASLGVVLLDLSLGRSSSEPVLAALRQIAPRVPILVTSGYAEDDALERLAPYGIAGFLQKPFTPAQLASRVADALARAR